MRKYIEYLLICIAPIFRLEFVQKLVKKFGIKLPSTIVIRSVKCDSQINFIVNDQNIIIQSYNTPLDRIICWCGIFGLWEKTQLKFWSKEIFNTDIVLDIGANSGIYSIVAATNPNVFIHSFEPVPVVKDMMLKSISLNDFVKNITVNNCLVGDRVGKQTLYIPYSGWVDVSSIDKKNIDSKYKDSVQELVCDMVTVDEYLQKLSLKNNTRILAKIDVEGAELQVLKGMQNALKNYLFSFSAELLTKKFFDDFIRYLPSDYICYTINEKKEQIHQTKNFINSVTNYFFTKENRGNILYRYE